jgi:hypothetical protein
MTIRIGHPQLGLDSIAAGNLFLDRCFHFRRFESSDHLRDSRL